MIDAAEFGKQMGALVREATAPLLKRIEELERRQPLRGEKGEPGLPGDRGLQGADGVPGRDGKDGAPGKDGERGIQGHDGAPGKDGRDGKDGIDGNPGRDGKDGERGMDGAPGKDGEPGKPGADGKDAPPPDLEAIADRVVAKLLESGRIKTLASLEAADAVAEYLKANPVQNGRDGAPGRDGKNGIDGAPGERGKQGDKGADGKDGAGVADLLIDRDGALVATMTDGRMKSLGVVVGKDGRDGLSVDSLEVFYDQDSHEVVERWSAQGKAKEMRRPAGGIKHGGYWREGTKAVAGETWTHGGIAWIAKRSTSTKPERDAADWEIFANKGRDGSDGKDGRNLAPPAPVSLVSA